VTDRVEHQRDPGQRLHRAVVKVEGDPAPLVLFGGDPLLELADSLALLAPALALPPLDPGLFVSQ
jgi:hypothetical protein